MVWMIIGSTVCMVCCIVFVEPDDSIFDQPEPSAQPYIVMAYIVMAYVVMASSISPILER